MQSKAELNAIRKAQFKAKYGVDLTDAEYQEYTRRSTKLAIPLTIPTAIFLIFAMLVFFFMIGLFSSGVPASVWTGAFVFLVIMTCASVVGLGITAVIFTKKFVGEIKARRQQEADVEHQRQAQVEQQHQVEQERQHQIQQKQQAVMETTRMDKLKKLVKVSERLKISQMAQILGMDETTLYDRIVDWAADYGFTLDEDVVKFGGGRKDEFIAALDGAFQGWDKKVETKDGKLD